MSLKNLIQKYPVSCYFIMAFTISWLGAFIVVAPKLLSGQPIPKMDGILMFPVMIIGPAVAGITLTAVTDGKTGIRNLRSRMVKWKVSVKWYLIALLIPPCLIIIVLLFLKNFVSAAFTPNLFPFGILFGVPAGFFEEIGWTGYAIPKMLREQSVIKTGIFLGFIWGLWHLPVIDFLGAASPHGQYWLPFAASFILAMIAVRVIIVWVYSNTSSILLAQFIHVISTGSLVVLGPNAVSAAQEALWYLLYAALLWIIVLIIWMTTDRNQKAAIPPFRLQTG